MLLCTATKYSNPGHHKRPHDARRHPVTLPETPPDPIACSSHRSGRHEGWLCVERRVVAESACTEIKAPRAARRGPGKQAGPGTRPRRLQRRGRKPGDRAAAPAPREVPCRRPGAPERVTRSATAASAANYTSQTLMSYVRRGPDRCSRRSRSRPPLAPLAPTAAVPSI